MTPVEARIRIRSLAIDLLDGDQVPVEPAHLVTGPDGPVTDVRQIPEILAHPDGWITIQQEVYFQPDDEWCLDGPEKPAVRWIYARGVGSVLVIYDEADA